VQAQQNRPLQPQLLRKLIVRIFSSLIDCIDPKVNSKEFKDTIIRKIQFCSQQFDYNDDAHDQKEKVNLVQFQFISIE
jgi:hypothetical protein